MQTTAGDNPFRPPQAAAAAQAPAETIEFAGVSMMGKRTDLIFFDKTTKKHRWVPLGETIDGISALKYDAGREQAIVKINGEQKTLPMRKGTGPTNAPAAVAPMHTGFATPAPVPVPVAAGNANVPAGAVATLPATASGQPGAPAATPPAAPASPTSQPPMTEQAKQEQEARMLVSDLLEIGMAQRKAYEEAQRKQQSGEQPNPTPNAPTNVPAPVVQQPQPLSPGPQPAPGRPPGNE